MSRPAGTASFDAIRNKIDSLKKNPNFNVNLQKSVERTQNSQHVILTRDQVTESFTSEYFKRIDDYNGLFSTQQLSDLDFSKFKNHVFFDSAVDKVYYAYDRILNHYPYDKNEYLHKIYFNNIDGYTRYIYDNYIPKNRGYLNFNGENVVSVNDVTGNLLNDYEGNVKAGLIDINKNKFSFDFWLYVNNVENSQELGTQIVFQKLIGNEGITIYLDEFFLDNVFNKKFCNINLLITHQKNYFLCKSRIPLGEFSNINFSLISVKGKRYCKFYLNGLRVKSNSSGTISKNQKFSEDFIKKSFTIGNGLSHNVLRDENLNVNKTSGLLGYIDEFRFFIGGRSDEEIFENIHKNIFAQPNLSIYYKFNEPSGEYLNNKIVLDSSGNKVHGIIEQFSGEQYSENVISTFRDKNENIEIPLIYEDINYCPVIFARYGNIIEEQNEILKKAKEYDEINPNVIYKFFPKSLFTSTADLEAKDSIYVAYESIRTPEGGAVNKIETPKNTIVLDLILIWARFFDQLKCYLDQITNIIKIDYDEINKDHSSVILPYAVSQLGFDFKEIFPSPILEKLNKKNLTYEKVFSENSIRQIQNNLWKRFLINSKDYIQSKGTLNAIKSVFNSFGLEQDLFINVREFNSQNKFNMHPNFIQKLTSLKHIDFFNQNLIKKDPVFDENNVLESGLTFSTSFFNENGTQLNFENDWSLETFVKFDHLKVNKYKNKQTILRLDNDLSSLPYISVVFERNKSDSFKGKVTLFVNELNNNNKVKICEINDVNLLSGKIYYICVNKKTINQNHSEYYLNIINSDFGSRNNTIRKNKCVVYSENKNVDFSQISLVVGNKNNYTNENIESYTNLDFFTSFEGKLMCVRGWQKFLDKEEINIHKTDMFCTGTNLDAIHNVNSNLIFNVSFVENYSVYKENTSNNIEIFNSVDNDVTFNLFISNDLLQEKVLNTLDYVVMTQSPNIDYPESFNRINIVSYNDKDLSREYNNFETNPSFDTYGNFSNNDEARLSIDFSTSKFVNKEISKMILLNDYFTKTLSNRTSLYEESYQNLNNLKNIFYNKLEKEINIKQLYQIYKYFDNILEDLLFEAIPSKIHYQGFNFVYESNILERHKYVYKMSDSRIPYKDNDIQWCRYDKRYENINYWNNKEVRDSQFTSVDNFDFVNQIQITNPFGG